MLTFGSLFSGIGGLDLGLERAGWVCRWQVENDPHATAILARHWPGVRRFGDIRSVDPTELEPVDLVCGGFPCQPTSSAGRRRGKADDRWLWPEFARILGGVRPRFAVLENPTGLLAFPEFGDVLGDLARLGFDAEWDALPAASVGAPHVRDRVFVVAYAHGGRGGAQPGLKQAKRPEEPDSSGSGDVADSGRFSGQQRRVSRDLAGSPRARAGEAPERERVWNASVDSREDLSDPNRGDGYWRRLADEVGRQWIEEADATARHAPGTQWSPEPDLGRVAYGVPARVDRLTRLGNAVVPQVAEVVGRAIVTAHNRGA